MFVLAVPEALWSGGIPQTKHIMGTLRMGTDPDQSVTDPYGKFHDLENLYCADGGVYVTSTGFNPTVTPRGHVMLDEKAARTAHVAIGRNTGPYGGDNEATIHIDCVFSGPEVEADGRRVELPAYSP